MLITKRRSLRGPPRRQSRRRPFCGILSVSFLKKKLEGFCKEELGGRGSYILFQKVMNKVPSVKLAFSRNAVQYSSDEIPKCRNYIYKSPPGDSTGPPPRCGRTVCRRCHFVPIASIRHCSRALTARSQNGSERNSQRRKCSAEV